MVLSNFEQNYFLFAPCCNLFFTSWDMIIYIIIRYWMVPWFCDSFCLSVCPFAIETTFPLSNFITKHIFGIIMTLRKFLKLWAPQAPPKKGAEGDPIFFFTPKLFHVFLLLPPAKAAVSKMGAGGAQTRAPKPRPPPEGEGNPAVGECFASIYLTPYHLLNIISR